MNARNAKRTVTKLEQKKEKILGKMTNKITRRREMEGLTSTIEEFLRVAQARIKEDEIIQILNDPNKQFNPKTINSIIATLEWGIKPRQICEAQSPLKGQGYG